MPAKTQLRLAEGPGGQDPVRVRACAHAQGGPNLGCSFFLGAMGEIYETNQSG